MATEQKKSVFATLNAIDCSEHIEKKKNGQTELSYLSWPWAWAEVQKLYPDADYNVYKDEQQRPYIEDPDYGLMCYTTVTIEGKTREMWLPVMNGANKAMRRQAYKYTVFNSYKKCDEEKTVEAATMFDINKTIMRCLVKNLAMFGLGLYIYAGEDLPEDVVKEQEQAAADAKTKIIEQVKAAKNRAEVTSIWNAHKELQADAQFKAAVMEMGNKYPAAPKPQPQPQQPTNPAQQ
ncbi:MAG: DUF1071 domain-containing protein [Paludibacteraceae bacterium]|nr:DUF1071 domain-containing protein [Paludibacteraceae bacterium]MBR0065434.1 DUF1071 domain-containing protein [Paludibacteraceae bacterium]